MNLQTMARNYYQQMVLIARRPGRNTLLRIADELSQAFPDMSPQACILQAERIHRTLPRDAVGIAKQGETQ